MIDNLKPCPCCGGNADIDYIDDGNSMGDFWIECSECEMTSANDRSQEEAIKIWNKRYGDKYTLNLLEGVALEMDFAAEYISSCVSMKPDHLAEYSRVFERLEIYIRKLKKGE